jgi:hypothetical protein
MKYSYDQIDNYYRGITILPGLDYKYRKGNDGYFSKKDCIKIVNTMQWNDTEFIVVITADGFKDRIINNEMVPEGYLIDGKYELLIKMKEMETKYYCDIRKLIIDKPYDLKESDDIVDIWYNMGG